MSFNSLFKIILRVLGLIAILNFVQMVYQNYTQFAFFLQNEDGLVAAIGMAFALVLLTALYGYVVYNLIYKTERVIRYFKLDEGFKEDRVKMKLSSNTVYKVVIVLYGFYLILNNLPVLARNFFMYYRSKIDENTDLTDYTLNVLYENLLFTIIGFILISERKRISSYLKRIFK